MPALLEIENVTKRFGGLIAINNVSFSVAEGQMTFIVGPNSAGKTTLFNLITSVYHADKGKITFKGEDITHTSPDKAAKMGIGRTFQIVKPLRNLTVLENVMLGAFMHTSKTSAAATAATEVLKFLEMDNVAHLPALAEWACQCSSALRLRAHSQLSPN